MCQCVYAWMRKGCVRCEEVIGEAEMSNLHDTFIVGQQFIIVRELCNRRRKQIHAGE